MTLKCLCLNWIFVVFSLSLFSQNDFNMPFPDFSNFDFSVNGLIQDTTRLDLEINPYGQTQGNSLSFLEALETTNGDIITSFSIVSQRGSYISSINAPLNKQNWNTSYTVQEGHSRFIGKNIYELQDSQLLLLGDYLPSSASFAESGSAAKTVLNGKTGQVVSAHMNIWQDGGAFIWNDGFTTAYEKVDGDIWVLDKYNLGNYASYVRTVDSNGLEKDTIILIPSIPAQNGNLSKIFGQRGLWKLNPNKYLSFHREMDPNFLDTSGVFNVLTHFDTLGNIIHQKNISENILNAPFGKSFLDENSLYFWSNVFIPNPISQWKGVIAQFDAENGSLIWNDIPTDENGDVLTVHAVKPLPNEKSVIAICNDSNDKFLIYQYKKNGDRVKLREFENLNDELKVSVRAVLPLKNKDLMLYFNVSPDTIIDGDRIWEYIGRNYFGLIKSEELNYTSSSTSVPFSDSKTMVFPNPTSGEVNLKFKRNHVESVNFYLTDINGKEVFKTSIDHHSDLNQIQLPPLLKGMYFYTISCEPYFSESGKLMVR